MISSITKRKDLLELMSRRRFEIDFSCGSAPFPKKLFKAFEALNHMGVAAGRMYCCQSCGHAEMEQLIKDLELENYIFFHDQDQDRYLETGELYLAFDLSEDAKKLVMNVLENHNLKPEWNWSNKTRIKLILNERKTKNEEKKEPILQSQNQREVKY